MIIAIEVFAEVGIHPGGVIHAGAGAALRSERLNAEGHAR